MRCNTETAEDPIFKRNPSAPTLLQTAGLHISGSLPLRSEISGSKVDSPQEYAQPLKRRESIVVCPFMEISPKGIASLLRACVLDSTDCVYDVGCGKGNIASEILERYPCRVVAVEVNASLARIARQRLKKFGERATVLVDDVCNIDMSDATVVVTSFITNALKKVSMQMASRLHPGCIWMNYTWAIPGWQTSRPSSDGVYTYVVGAHLWDGFENLREDAAQDSLVNLPDEEVLGLIGNIAKSYPSTQRPRSNARHRMPKYLQPLKASPSLVWVGKSDPLASSPSKTQAIKKQNHVASKTVDGIN
jgi:SAM-dependent methyltransferase